MSLTARHLVGLLALLLSLATVCAQNAPLDTTPAICLAFPFEKSPAGILSKYTLLINDTTILPARAILRVIYTPPRVEDDRMRAIRSSNSADASWTRDNRLKEGDKLSPSEQARLKVSRETVWPSETNFQLALAGIGADDLRIVYVVTGEKPEDAKFFDQHFLLPEGLFLAEVNGAVTVLAVEKSKPGERAGIVANDTIIRVGETPVNGSLTTYLEAYHAAKRNAISTSKPSFPVTLKGADGTEKTLAIRLPPSLNTSFLDSPIDTTPTPKAATNAPPLNISETWEKQKPTQPAAPKP